MADRSAPSSATAGRADCSRAMRCTGRLVGDAMSAAGLGTKENPVTAPPAPRLTSAVACCHQGLLAEGMLSPRILLRWAGSIGQNTQMVLNHASGRILDKRLRIAWTCGSLGFCAFSNSTAA